jgi:hypothetical protein
VGFPRPNYDIADIVRQHRRALEAEHRLSRAQKRVLTAISRCRTAALGGHLEVCTGCGREHPVYNSCRNRHCPKCQALAQQKWIEARAARILPARHFHGVFTPPSELRPLAMRHPAEVYTALFRSVSDLLLELGRTHLQATPGLTMVLHTWTRDLRFHPHLHVLITAGGLALDGKRFVHVRKDYLFNVEVMGRLLRGKMLDALRKLNREGAFPELTQRAFNRLMASLAAHKCWVVYAKAPFRRSQHVLSYLGRYTHRVGIANSRLLDIGPTHVTFRTKGKQTATLHPVAFLRRFLLHILPDGFHKIRHAGLYASAQPGGLLEKARALLPLPKPRKKAQPVAVDAPRTCAHCGGIILRLPLTAMARSPPLTLDFEGRMRPSKEPACA